LVKIPAPVTLPKPVGTSLTPLDTLRTILEMHGFNQRMFAQRSGLSEPLISTVLSGHRRATRPFVEAVAGVFQLPPGFFEIPEAEPTQPTRRAKKCSICGHWKVDLEEHKARRHGEQPPEPVAP
jgi:transcriptional regulator with XRE-family HTH domain